VRDARATRPAPRIGPHPIRPSATFPGEAGEGLAAAASWAAGRLAAPVLRSGRGRCARISDRSSRPSTPQTGRARPASRVEGLDGETPRRADAVIPKGPERSEGAPQALDGDDATGLQG